MAWIARKPFDCAEAAAFDRLLLFQFWKFKLRRAVWGRSLMDWLWVEHEISDVVGTRGGDPRFVCGGVCA
jgi:hypothetical protein